MEQHAQRQTELDLSWKHVISVWWLIIWRATLGGMLLGGGFGFIIGFVGTMMGYDNETLALWSSIIGGLAGLVWGLFVIKMALNKRYKGFRLALVPA